MSIFDNPFYTLGVSAKSNRQQISSKAEEKIFLNENESKSINEARNILIIPDKRLVAEIRWFPGVSDRNIREIIDYFEKCFASERRPNDVTAAEFLSESANAELSRILLTGSEDPRNDELSAFEDSVKKLRLANMKKIYAKTFKEFENYMNSGNPAYAEKFQESLKLKYEMDELQFAIKNF